MFDNKKYQKQYYLKDKEKILGQNRQYYKDHREEIRESCKKYYKNHREELLEKANQYSKNNSEKRSKYMKLYRKEKNGFIQEYKLSKGCSVCGYNKCVSALDFHHPNDDKEFTIGHFLSENISIEKIKIEMEECIILRANCHRGLHFESMK